ncbi:MAG: cation:proton antiporter, partial [Candidatus Methanoperedens sp.]|nr:cation:proton antiporter [Candidatus Methanoperedens sp.]
MSTTYLLTAFVVVMIIGIFSHMLGKILKVPSIVFLLIAGIILGPEVTGIINADSFGNGIELFVAFSVAIIVFDGGLDIDIRQIRKIQKGILNLVTAGILITSLLSSAAAYLLLNIPFNIALLFGALVSATGPTVITPIIRQTGVNTRVANTLQAEAVLNDGISVILAALVFEWIVSSLTGIKVVQFLLIRLLDAAFFGILSGIILILVLRKIPLLTEQSGILAMAIFGIFIGSSDIPHKKVIKDFKEDISIVLLSIIFILLSTFIDFDYIKAIGIKGVILVFILMLLIRPLAVYISTRTSDLKPGEKIFIAATGPRGVVPASMAVYFTLRLNDYGFTSESISLLGLMFMTIVITVLATGLSARFIANKTGVVPMEILIIGGGTVGRALAERFMKRGENVVIIDNNEENCKRAVQLGIRVVH